MNIDPSFMQGWVNEVQFHIMTCDFHLWVGVFLALCCNLVNFVMYTLPTYIFTPGGGAVRLLACKIVFFCQKKLRSSDIL